MASRIFSIRLDDSAVEALERLQIPDDDSLNATAKRVLLDALGVDVNSKVNTVNSDHLQELVDSKTAYLATAVNEVKTQIEELQNKLNQHEEWFKKCDEVNRERNELAQENWLLKSQLNNAIAVEATTTDATATPQQASPKATQPRRRNTAKK